MYDILQITTIVLAVVVNVGSRWVCIGSGTVSCVGRCFLETTTTIALGFTISDRSINLVELNSATKS